LNPGKVRSRRVHDQRGNAANGFTSSNGQITGSNDHPSLDGHLPPRSGHPGTNGQAATTPPASPSSPPGIKAPGVTITSITPTRDANGEIR
jgi:hypothetical protein